jgi:hypothetical protein
MTDDCEDLTAGDLEVDAIERAERLRAAAELLRHRLKADEWRYGRIRHS